jgi:hypothetical protein
MPDDEEEVSAFKQSVIEWMARKSRNRKQKPKDEPIKDEDLWSKY